MRLQIALIEACNKAGMIGDLIPPITHVEDDGDYIHFCVEAWSTWKYSYRKSDGRYIREATALNGAGLDEETLVSRIVDQQASRAAFLKAYDAAKAEADGNAQRIVILDRDEARMLVVPQHVADAMGSREHFFQVWVGNGERPFTWDAFDATEAARFTQAYHSAPQITRIDVITRAAWELQYKAEEEARKIKKA